MPGCSYLFASIRDLFPHATVGALPWETLTGAEQTHVLSVEGPHGPELQLALHGRKAPRATAATLVLGPNEGSEVVYTIHPGMPLRPGIERRGATAVKFV
jgi:hypothetical protein